MKRYSSKRRRLMLRGDNINRLDVFERDAWTCHICNRPISQRLRFPHPLAATIDHVVPLCRGGEHVWNNVAAAHAFCNFRKSDSFDLELITG